MFTDTEFMTAKEKESVLRAWKRFLKGGLAKKDFTKAVYDHLHLHLPFIAHYSQQGFYDTYFTTGDGTQRFFQTFLDFIEGDMSNMRNPDYDDINAELVKEFRKVEGELLAAAKALQKASDLRHAKALLAKHGMAQLPNAGE